MQVLCISLLPPLNLCEFHVKIIAENASSCTLQLHFCLAGHLKLKIASQSAKNQCSEGGTVGVSNRSKKCTTGTGQGRGERQQSQIWMFQHSLIALGYAGMTSALAANFMPYCKLT